MDFMMELLWALFGENKDALMPDGYFLSHQNSPFSLQWQPAYSQSFHYMADLEQIQRDVE